jgi:hypothetical protein
LLKVLKPFLVIPPDRLTCNKETIVTVQSQQINDKLIKPKIGKLLIMVVFENSNPLRIDYFFWTLIIKRKISNIDFSET